MGEKETKIVGKNAPAIWAVLSSVLVLSIIVVFQIHPGLHFLLISVSSAAIPTFIFANLGVKRLNRFRYTKARAFGIGLLFGFFALLFSALIWTLFIDVQALLNYPPTEVASAYLMSLYVAFLFGGFLGPLCGALTGFFLARKLRLPNPTSKSG